MHLIAAGPLQRVIEEALLDLPEDLAVESFLDTVHVFPRERPVIRRDRWSRLAGREAEMFRQYHLRR